MAHVVPSLWLMLPGLADANILSPGTPTPLQLEGEGKISLIQRTLVRAEDAKKPRNVKLVVAAGTDPDGTEVAAECAKIVAIWDEKVAKKIKPPKPEKEKKVRRVPKKKKRDGVVVSSLDAFLAGDDDVDDDPSAAAVDAALDDADDKADDAEEERPPKRRRGDPELPWEEHALLYSIMSIMWLKERDGDFSELIYASINQIEEVWAMETILGVLRALNKDQWTVSVFPFFFLLFGVVPGSANGSPCYRGSPHLPHPPYPPTPPTA